MSSTIDLRETLTKIQHTGRAGSVLSFCCPESMSRSCFRILTLLLILWQLFLPCSAPWLHTCVEPSCAHTACATGVKCSSSPVAENSRSKAHSCRCSCHHLTENSTNDGSHGKPPGEPHDCSSCALCQAIAAPRILASLVSLPSCEDLIEVLRVAECADPLLGFGLPPRCRAPPFAGRC